MHLSMYMYNSYNGRIIQWAILLGGNIINEHYAQYV